jgi:DNA primase
VSDVVVHTPDDSPGEEVAEAIEQVAEQQQSLEIGVLLGKVESLEEKIQYHDDLISLHTHDGLAQQDTVMETENRLVAKIDALIDDAIDEAVSEEVAEEVVETPAIAESNEESAEQVEESNEDEPPKSRAKRTPLAERYYKSSKHKI